MAVDYLLLEARSTSLFIRSFVIFFLVLVYIISVIYTEVLDISSYFYGVLLKYVGILIVNR